MIPRLYVPPPVWTPARFGLLSVVQPRFDDADPHWRNGITYQVQCGGAADTYDPCVAILADGSPAPTPPPKPPTDEMLTRAATPFTVFASMQCNAVGWFEQASAHAEAALTRAERWQVERAFWTGLAAGQQVVYPHLAADAVVTDGGATLQTAATVLGSGSVDAVKALALLEQALADCYEGQGVIHVPDALVPILAGARQIMEDDGRLRTWNGNLVAAGSGYPGTGPDGSPPGTDTLWMYATGQLVAYRGAPEVTRPEQGLDRATNVVTVLAEREFLLAWDCCHFAVQVQVENAGGGGGGVQASDISATEPLAWDADTETMSVDPGSDGQYLGTASGAAAWQTAGQPGTLAGPLDGTGKIPAGQLPPVPLHETFEAANQAAMLAAPVSAPAVAVRTDFSPAHLFYLHTDPASTLGNWEDLGAGIGAAADPTGQVGTAPINGAAATYMRSDGAPAINQGMSPTWTGHHTFAGPVTIPPGAGAGKVFTSDATGDGTWEPPAVASVAGKTGAVSLTKADVGLSNVDNTADLAKPVSTAVQTALNAKADTTALNAHTANTANPHAVTKAQVGLSNVDNTADLAKPVSTAQQTAITAVQTALTTHEGATGAGTHLPAGGTAGQVPVKGAGTAAAWATLTAADLAALPLAGGTLSGLLTILQNVAGIKARLAMKLPGQQNDAPTTLGIASTYLGIGGGEWGANSYRLIGLGYIAAVGNEYPAFIGYQETSTTSNTRGDLIFGTRNNNNNAPPTTILRINSAGQILAEAGAAYVPGSDGALITKKNLDDAGVVAATASTLAKRGPTGTITAADAAQTDQVVTLAQLNAAIAGIGTQSDLGTPEAHNTADVFLTQSSPTVQLISTTVGDVEVHLPLASEVTAGKRYIIKRVTAGGQGLLVKVDDTNGAVIDGTPSIGMSAQHSFREVVFDGTNWQIIGSSGA